MVTDHTHAEAEPIRVWFPNAHTVFAVGSFNNWSTTATLLRAVGEGLWEFRLPPSVRMQELCFFVMRSGQMFGRVYRYAAEDAMVGRTCAG